jgi:hypothetical protein
LRAFSGPALLPSVIGLVVVAQSIISSLFNTSLFDSTHGWLYVWGVGVLGGMALRASPSVAARDGKKSDRGPGPG